MELTKKKKDGFIIEKSSSQLAMSFVSERFNDGLAIEIPSLNIRVENKQNNSNKVGTPNHFSAGAPKR